MCLAASKIMSLNGSSVNWVGTAWPTVYFWVSLTTAWLMQCMTRSIHGWKPPPRPPYAPTTTSFLQSQNATKNRDKCKPSDRCPFRAGSREHLIVQEQGQEEFYRYERKSLLLLPICSSLFSDTRNGYLLEATHLS